MQSNTHIHIFFPLQIRLVLINLAGGTRHVFPFTSCPAPQAAQWKPSILVCLQFVCLNFFANLGYLACWSCSGRPMLFIPLRHNTSRPFYPPPPQKSLHLINFCTQLLKKKVTFLWFLPSILYWSRSSCWCRGLSACAVKTARRPPRVPDCPAF